MNNLPQINASNPKPSYLGYQIALGETTAHFDRRPAISKIDGKKIVIVCIGASTPNQVMTPFCNLVKPLADVQAINCCVGSEDVNKWLDLNGNGWTNVATRLKGANIPYSRVQGMMFCADDLRDQGTGVNSIQLLRDKIIDFIGVAKSQFPNLKQIDMFSRFCEYKITDPKFGYPTGYNYGFGQKLVVEKSALDQTHGVWVTDATGYLWTNGEEIRSDGFQFRFDWMKQNGTSVHLDTAKNGDDISAAYIFNNMKRYAWFK